MNHTFDAVPWAVPKQSLRELFRYAWVPGRPGALPVGTDAGELPAAELAVTAWDDHEKGRSLTLRQLVAPDWYWYSGPAAYNQGAPLVNYLLRVYGPERFLKL